MRKYQENEDDREKLFEERSKNGKQVFGGSQGSATESFGAMFQGKGDLALQRKMENQTVEPVEESKTPQNTVVEPST